MFLSSGILTCKPCIRSPFTRRLHIFMYDITQCRITYFIKYPEELITVTSVFSKHPQRKTRVSPSCLRSRVPSKPLRVYGGDNILVCFRYRVNQRVRHAVTVFIIIHLFNDVENEFLKCFISPFKFLWYTHITGNRCF